MRDSYERPVGVHPPLAWPAYRSTASRAPTQPLVLLPQRLDRAGRAGARSRPGGGRATAT